MVPSSTCCFQGHITLMASSTSSQDEAYSYAGQMVASIITSMSLHTAMGLGVFEIIAKAGPEAQLSAEEIVAELTTKNPDAPAMLDRVLRLLASFSLLSCSAAADASGHRWRVYGLTPASRYYVPNEDGVSLAPVMDLIHDPVFLASWTQLKDAILEGGIPFDRVHGMHAFEYQSRDARFNKVFNTAMLNHSTLILKRLLETYHGFEHLHRVVDVGGGVGVTLSMITSKYPFIRGVNFDLPHVIEHAPAYPGVEHVGGDMFEGVPKGDAIFMKGKLHDWNDDHCVKLLKNCYNSIPEKGKVIVLELVCPLVPKTNAIAR